MRTLHGARSGSRFDILNCSNDLYEDIQETDKFNRNAVVTYQSQTDFAKSKARNKGIFSGKSNKFNKGKDVDHNKWNVESHNIMQTNVQKCVPKER